MSKFPTGKWIVKYATMIGKFEYNSARSTAWVTGMDSPTGWFSGGRYSRRPTKVVSLKVTGYSLSGVYRTYKPGGNKTKFMGNIRCKLQHNGELKLEVQDHTSSNYNTWHTFYARPESGSLRQNLSDAGYRHQVRFSGGGVGIKAYGAATMGNIEVRDLGSGWEKHYAMVAAGGGAGIGVSFPGSTGWVPCYLTPRCKNWVGATLGMYTAGAAVIVGYNKCLCSFRLPGGAKWEANWSGWGVNLEAKVDLGTLVVGKLLGTVYDKPYFNTTAGSGGSGGAH